MSVSSRRLAIAAALAAAVLAPLPSLGAQSPVAGTWVAEFELGMRNENGVVTTMGTGKARVALAVRGDSVFGTWLVVEPAGPAANAQPRALRGVFANGVLKLESEPSERRLRVNDEERVVKMLTRYEAKLEGNVLNGTSQNVATTDSGMEPPPARPFKAVKQS